MNDQFNRTRGCDLKRSKVITYHSIHIVLNTTFYSFPFITDVSARIGSNIATVEDGLNHLKNMFPRELFKNSLPPIFWKHQLYALINNRTLIDQTLVWQLNL